MIVPQPLAKVLIFYGVHKMIKIEHNVINNEIKEIPLTANEIKQAENLQKTALAEQVKIEAEVKARETARQAILDRLGLTADEAKLLLG